MNHIIQYLYPAAVNGKDYRLQDNGVEVGDDGPVSRGVFIAYWDVEVLGPMPTTEQIEAARPAADASLEVVLQKQAVEVKLLPTDDGMVRAAEDLIVILLNKKTLSKSDLPADLIDKINERRALRGEDPV